jgi:hypothetical protein
VLEKCLGFDGRIPCRGAAETVHTVVSSSTDLQPVI